MKSIVSKESNPQLGFPRLMISDNGCIVLFSKKNKGVCVYNGNTTNAQGGYSELWDMEVFTDFKGSVTLSND